MVVARKAEQTSSLTASWMVACATQLQLADPSQYMQVPSAVDQLKQQLLLAVENGDPVGASDVISNLEKSPLTKEILEATRIGAAVNDVRKRTSSTYPDLSKKCRGLIKLWQKLLENRPSSSNGTCSNGGTPNTPVTRRGLTPQTPGRKVGTPARTQIASPGLGEIGSGYAPNTTKVSPKQEGQLPKSHSVGSELCRSASRASSKTASPSVRVARKRPVEKVSEVEIGTTDKRPCLDDNRNQTPSTSPPTHVSILAARRQNALPTSNLVAQLSEDPIPQPPLARPNANSVENHVRRSEPTEERPVAVKRPPTASVSSPAITNGVSSQKPKVKPAAQKPKPVLNAAEKKPKPVVKPSVVQSITATTSDVANEKKKDRKNKPLKPVSSNPKQLTEDDFFYASEDDDEDSAKKIAPPKGRKCWYSAVPSARELAERVATEASPAQTPDPSNARAIPSRNREFLVLPYSDVGLPDFKEFRFKDPKRFIASDPPAVRR